MTREEAANWLEHYCYGNTNILRDCDDDIAEKIQTAMDEAIAALRGPQPDPDTGLVPCGCWYCEDGVMQVSDSPNKPPVEAKYCGLCGKKLEVTE